MNENSTTPSSALDAIASNWIARRDRGLTPKETAELSRWLEDPRHADAFARCESWWQALPSLSQLPAADLASLMTPPKRRLAPVLWFIAATASAAAAIVLALRVPVSSPSTVRTAVEVFSASPEASRRVGLPDGSIALLDRGSRIAFGAFPSGRHVRLITGEAHFTVAKTAAPFFVHVGNITVRDIGTAFNVRLASDRIAVLVTEGKVELRSDVAPVLLTAGQQAVVQTISHHAPVDVTALDPEDFERTLAWKKRRLVFDRTPLFDAIAELNRDNVRQLVLGDNTLASILIAGSVQSDNLDGFVRLLESGFGLVAESRGDEIVLRKSP